MSAFSSSSDDCMSIELNTLYITPSEYHSIVFEEILNLVDSQGEVLDEVTIAVEQGEPKEVIDPYQREFTVYQYSRQESMMLRVQSRVNRGLKTISELRKIRRPNYSRLLRVTEAGDGVDVFSVRIEGQEGSRYKASIPEPEVRDHPLLLEGANILLLRRLAVGQLTGRFTGRTVDHDGQLCAVHYRVERDAYDGVRVVRTVTGEDGEEEVMTTRLSGKGRILHHEWSNSQWRLEGVRPKPKAEAGDEQSETETDEEVPVDLDAYFERKEDLIEEMKEYLSEQPDVQDMIADFMKNLLFDKPEDVIQYADNFFSDFMGVARGDSITGYKSCSEYDI